jgi:protein TonB
VIFGVVAVGVLVLGLLGVGVYQAMQRAEHRQQRAKLVDFVDSATNAAPAPPPGDSALELGVVETPPELLNREEVAGEIARSYPPLLRDAGVTGSVTLRMRIDSDGVVDGRSIEVLESTHDRFSEAASRVAQRLRFRPATVGGKPVPVWVTLPVTFQLTS